MELLNSSTCDGHSEYLECGTVKDYRPFLYMEKFWPSWFGGYEEVYRTAGAIEAKVDGEAVVQHVAQQWRLLVLANFMRQVFPGYAKILDYGCSRGAHAINLHNSFRDKAFTCVDIDRTSVGEAQRLVARLAKHPAMFDFVVGDERTELQKGYDGAMVLEVLEHVKDVKKLVDKLEASVRPGGWMMFTTPAGPIEYDMWVQQPERLREHVRELTLDDILDIFGGKDSLHIDYSTARPCPHTGMMIGCHFFAYRTSDKPTGTIDWRRKLSTVHSYNGELPGWNEKR